GRIELDRGEHGAGRQGAQREAAARQRRIDRGAQPGGERQAQAERRGQHDGSEHEPGEVAELAGDQAGSEPRLEHPVVDDEQRDGGECDRVHRLADRHAGSLGAIDPAERASHTLEDRPARPIALGRHAYTMPVVSESGKQSESVKQLAAAEEEAKQRFERATTQLREGAYRFSSRARGQSELIIEELIDPEGETVASIAEVEGDQGAVALAQSLELITFDTWLFGQIGDKEELDLKAEEHWEVWFSFGAWIGETMRRRSGGHWLMMGDDPHTWRVGFSKIFLEIAPFVFAEQLLRMGSGA